MIYAYHLETNEVRKIDQPSKTWEQLPDVYATIIDEIYYCQKIRDITIKARYYTCVRMPLRAGHKHSDYRSNQTNRSMVIYIQSNKPIKVETRIDVYETHITINHDKHTHEYTLLNYDSQITTHIKNVHTKYLIDIETLPFEIKQ